MPIREVGMSEFYGTETPWIVVRGSTAGCQVISESAPKLRRNVASVGGPRRDANARLISAAPELLGALEGIMDDVLGNRAAINEERITSIRAAINKALGQ